MRNISADEIEQAVADLCIQACCILPEDVSLALAEAGRRESSDLGKQVFSDLRENELLAKTKMRPICQDTGMVIVYVDLGTDAHLEGDLYQAVNRGVARGYVDGCLRKSTLDPISRKPYTDNTPAIVHLRLMEGDRMKITVAPKGAGSENKGVLKMLLPGAGIAGIEDFVVQAVSEAGSGFCPPGIIGVGIGGNMESACLLAKRQLLRRTDEPSPDPVLREMEQRLVARINALNIGPMGYGGTTTVLAVHIGKEPTHIAQLPVAICFQCHAARHAEVLL